MLGDKLSDKKGGKGPQEADTAYKAGRQMKEDNRPRSTVPTKTKVYSWVTYRV